MKKIFTTMIMVLAVAVAMAQAPEKFTYQAVVRNASNSLVANAPVGVRVSILQGGVNGTLVYMETHTSVTNVNGLITLQIGAGSVQQGSLADIDWANGSYFLKTETDPAGGTNYSITSTQQMLSVPYALYAKDAGNIPTIPANVSAFANDAGYITAQDIPEIPTVPTNVSAFTNDAGYLTNYTETDPQFNAWDKDYNDLINKPTIPTVPNNVSAFNNDAGYLTTFTETDPTVPVWAKEANKPTYNYSEIINTPTIPTVPTQVSAFTNDAGYLTSFTETDPQFNAWDKNYNDLTNKPTLFSGNYNDLTNKPTLFDGNYNSLTNKPNLATVAISGSYNDLINKPSIPTALGELTNNVGYITAAQVPAQVNADWNATTGAAQILNKPTLFSGNYNDLTNKPTIPTVPTNVSAFANDAGYVTSTEVQQAAGIPTVVSAFQNDAGYITASQVPAQVNADWNATSGVAKILNKPALFSGNYNDLTNKPTLFDGNYNSLTNKPNLAIVATTGNYNDLTNKPTIPTVPSNVSVFNNDAQYITEAQLNALLAAMNNTIDSLRDRIEELEDNPVQPQPAQTLGSVTTSAMNYVGVNSAVGGGNVTSDGGGSVQARGVCWSTSNPPYVTDSHTNEGTAVGGFTSNISGLNPGTTYYLRAYVTNSVGTAYGSVVNFTTENGGTPVLPTVTTGSVTDILPYTATFHGNVVYNGGTALMARGFVYGPAHNPTLEDNFTVDGITQGAFSSTVTNLSATMTYYVRAYATNSVGTVYGEEVSFVSSTTPPAVTTNEVTSISYTSASCGGDVPFSGGAAVSAKGLCYGLTEHPTINDNVIPGGVGVGSFTGNLTGLTANTTYYVRAYATNSVGTNYGEERVFSTLSYAIPTVAAVAPSDITYYTFTCGGNVTDEGSYPVTSRGICYSTAPMPTLADNYESLGSGTGIFSTTILGLSPSTTYYIRAYAINQMGMAYSEQMTVTTLANTKPEVATLSASGLGKCIGNITSTGGLAITDRGFCYSTYPNPTIVENFVSVGGGEGHFTAMLPNMVDGTTYFVRAYATNMLGTSYGQQISFTYGCGNSFTVTDYDGNVYNTLRLGNQCWMKENLRSTHYSDGTAIAAGGSTTSTTEAYYYTQGGSFNYGYLYNWKAVMRNSSSSQSNPSGVQGVCPTGWHVPSDAEWSELQDYVGGQSQYLCGSSSSSIAKALASTTGWTTSAETCAVGNNISSNNATGFGAWPAGQHTPGFESNVGRRAFFWSSTESSSSNAYDRFINNNNDNMIRGSFYNYKSSGFSVRCLRD